MKSFLKKLKSSRKEKVADEEENGNAKGKDGGKDPVSTKVNEESGQINAPEALSSEKEIEKDPDDFTMEHVKGYFQPYQHHLDDAGVGIKDALPMLLQHYDNAVKDPRGFIHHLAHGAGIKIIMDDAPISPEEREAHAEAAKDLEEFSKDKTPRDMERAAPVMHALVAYGIHDNLPDAYESAMWAHPESREERLKEVRRGVNISRSKMAAKSISNSAPEKKADDKPKNWKDLSKRIKGAR